MNMPSGASPYVMPAAPLTRPVFDAEAHEALSGQAKIDFRDAYRTQLSAYRDYRRRGGMIPQQQQSQPPPPAQTAPAPIPWTPPAPPQAPSGMVGSSYGVQGMMNALSGYGLPRY